MGVWQEYGDLFYLIYQFPPLPDSSLGGIEAYLAEFLEEQTIYENDAVSDFIAKAGLKTGLTSLAKSVKENADSV